MGQRQRTGDVRDEADAPTPPEIEPRAMSAAAATPGTDPRRRALGAFAVASPEFLRTRWAELAAREQVTLLRAPEVGLVMLRGRVGGGGAPFNLGEASVTRASVRLGSGIVGHAMVLGRDGEHARLAAAFDALWQDRSRRGEVEAEVVAPALAAEAAADAVGAEETEATRVDFFTLARGED